jgi:hypothetical protein
MQRGRLERSNRHVSVRRSSAEAHSQRRHHLQTVAGETLKRLPTSLTDNPLARAVTSANRPDNPSFALRWDLIPGLLSRRESWQTHSLEGGPDVSLSRSQPV